MHSAQQRAAFWLVISGFFALGMMLGAWQVLIPDLQRTLNISEGRFGFALTCGVVGSFPAMFYVGRWADRWGARYLMIMSCVLCAVSYALLALVNHFASLVFVVFCMLGAVGALDVAMNAAAVNYEQHTQDKKMSFFHAGYSGMASLAAMLTGVSLFAGVPFHWIYPSISLALLVLSFIFWRIKHLDHLIHQEPTAKSSQHKPSQGRLHLLKQPIMLWLSAIIVLCFFSEGSLELWSATYLRTSLDLPVLIGAAGPAVFHFAMMTGRLSSGWILRYFHRTNVLLASGLLAAVGMLLSVVSLSPSLILFGFLLAGLALAAVVPIVFSLAGDRTPTQAGEVISVITILGYGGFMLGPSLIGGLAHAFGLRGAFMALIVAGLGIFVLALLLRRDLHKAA